MKVSAAFRVRAARGTRLTIIAATALLLATCRGIDCDPTSPCFTISDTSPPEPALVVQSSRDGPIELYTMKSDGSGIRRLTNNPGNDVMPAWSPDGTKIAFASVRGGVAREIFVMNADGSNQQRLTTLGTAPGYPDWSPDGSRIVFHASRGGGDFALFVMNADGSNVRQITTTDSYLRPRWSPDGSLILATWFETTAQGSAGGKAAVIDLDGGHLKILSKQSMNDLSASWSPDGQHVVFRSVRGRNMDWMLVVVNADGTNERELGPNTIGAGENSWSKTTGRIYFSNTYVGGMIYSVRPDGSDLRRVSSDGGYGNMYVR
jgi:Tol biopolymer transport system component